MFMKAGEISTEGISRLGFVQHDLRYASQEGDANGVVRGQYAYLDPNYQWQQVSCLLANLVQLIGQRLKCALEGLRAS